MKKLMFAAFAAATVAGTAFAAATPEPANKAYNVTITTKRIEEVMAQMTKKNIPTNELEQAWADAEAAAPLDCEGNKSFYPTAQDRELAREYGMLYHYETTNKNGTVTIKWQQYKPAKNGTNIVAATKVFTEKHNYIVFLDKDNQPVDQMVEYWSQRGLTNNCKYYAFWESNLNVRNVVITGDGKVMAALADGDNIAGTILAGHGKAAKSNTADKSGPYDYAKSIAGNYADMTYPYCKYGTWKWSYDKKLSQAYQAALDDGKEGAAAIAAALLTKKIWLPMLMY